jgi:ornithine carbamoyltransferase
MTGDPHMTATWTTSTIWPENLIRVTDLTSAGLEELLHLAERMRADPARWTGALAGLSLACLFETPTTRAGLSTEAAAHRLGLEPIRVAPRELDVGPGELLEDAMHILSRYTVAIVTRDMSESELARIARVAKVPVVNAQSPGHHPCQALADLLTLREQFLELRGLVLAYVGPRSNIAISLMQAGAMAGMEVRLAVPPGDEPEPEDLAAAEIMAEMHGGVIRVGNDPIEAVLGADAVATAPWPVVDDDVERRRLHQRLRRYSVEPALMHRAKPTSIFLHSLPARRGEEVSAGVIDWRRSQVWEEAGNRLPAEQAVIYTLVMAARERASE